MNRMFYLSIVYDGNGYDRLDLLQDEKLSGIDNILLNLKDRKDILEHFSRKANPDKKGRIHIIYEDLDEKKKQLREYNEAPDDKKEEIKNNFSYAHIIPRIPHNRKLYNAETCKSILKTHLHDEDVIKEIMNNTKIKVNGEEVELKTNKQYIFEADDEKYSLDINHRDVHDAIDRFLTRLQIAKPETLYFYFRTLMNICNLTVIKKPMANLSVNEKKIVRFLKNRQITDMTPEEKLEEESKNMDDFWTYHDLDEVIKYSKDENRPIGSESEETLNEKNNGWKRSM